MCMSILHICAESVQCLSKPKEDLKLQDCEWPDLGVGNCPQRSKEGIGPAGIGILDGSEPPCGGWESNHGPLQEEQVLLLLSHLSNPILNYNNTPSHRSTRHPTLPSGLFPKHSTGVL